MRSENQKPFKKSILTLLVCIVSVVIVPAQGKLIPFLSNDLYGFADDKGKIVIKPVYEEVNMHGFDLLAVKDDGLWGILNGKGETIMKPTLAIEVPLPNYMGRPHGPIIKRVYNKEYNIDEVKQPYIGSQLYQIEDDKAKLYYYIHPNHPQKSYRAYTDAKNIRRRSDNLTQGISSITGIIKVGTPDGKINFVDSTGAELFKTDVYDGEALNEHVIAVQNEAGMYGLFDRNQNPISKFMYSRVRQGDDGNFIITGRLDSIKRNTEYFTLYSKLGEIIVKDHDHFMSTKDKRALVMAGDIATMYDVEGNKVAVFENAEIQDMIYEDDKFWIHSNKKTGIIDEMGNYILKPRYASMQRYSNGKFSYSDGNKGGLLDKLYEPEWGVDSIRLLDLLYNLPGHYKAIKSVEKGWRSFDYYAIVDSVGNVILPPVYENIAYYEKSSVFLVRKDSIQSVLDYDGNILVPYTKDKLEVEDQSHTARKITNGGLIKIDLITLKTSEPQIPKFNVQILKKEGMSFLADADQKPLTTAIYKHLEPKWKHGWSGLVFVGRRTDAEDEFVDILNAEGKNVLPAGYGVYYKNAEQVIKNNAVTVFHKEDVIKLNNGTLNPKSGFRCGIVNFQGEWVIPSGYQMFANLDDRILRSASFETNTYSLYNFKGALISPVKYSYVQDPGDKKFKFNRVIVAVPDPSPINPAYKVKVGAIDLTGKQIIPLDFVSIEPFNFAVTGAKKLDKNGVAYSILIDTMGREVFRSEYDRMYLMQGDSTQIIVEKDKKKGVLNINGTLMLRPEYTTIQYHKDLNGYFARGTDSTFFISEKTPAKKVAIGFPGLVSEVKLDGGYFYSYQQDRTDHKKLYTHYFDLDGNYYGQVIGYGIKSQLFGVALPSGYIAVSDTAGGKPYEVNFVTGRKFKD